MIVCSWYGITCKSRLTSKSMCPSIYLSKSEQEVFDIWYPSELCSEWLYLQHRHKAGIANDKQMVQWTFVVSGSPLGAACFEQHAWVFASCGAILQKSMSNVDIRYCSGTTSDVYACQMFRAGDAGSNIPFLTILPPGSASPPSSCAAICLYLCTARATEGQKW